MFDFLRRSTPRPLTDAIRHAIESDGMTAAVSNPSLLRMVESKGRYSDRKVTYFRVFDPSSTAQRAMDIRRYQDFDVFQGLVLRAGHVESDGKIVLTRPVVTRAAEPMVRTRAGRLVPINDADAAVNGNASPSATLHIVEASTGGEAR
jgi:hypothetical protein